MNKSKKIKWKSKRCRHPCPLQGPRCSLTASHFHEKSRKEPSVCTDTYDMSKRVRSLCKGVTRRETKSTGKRSSPGSLKTHNERLACEPRSHSQPPWMTWTLVPGAKETKQQQTDSGRPKNVGRPPQTIRNLVQDAASRLSRKPTSSNLPKSFRTWNRPLDRIFGGTNS